MNKNLLKFSVLLLSFITLTANAQDSTAVAEEAVEEIESGSTFLISIGASYVGTPVGFTNKNAFRTLPSLSYMDTITGLTLNSQDHGDNSWMGSSVEYSIGYNANIKMYSKINDDYSLGFNAGASLLSFTFQDRSKVYYDDSTWNIEVWDHYESYKYDGSVVLIDAGLFLRRHITSSVFADLGLNGYFHSLTMDNSLMVGDREVDSRSFETTGLNLGATLNAGIDVSDFTIILSNNFINNEVGFTYIASLNFGYRL